MGAKRDNKKPRGRSLVASAEKEKYGREGEEKKNECEGAPSSLPTTAGARRKMAPLLFFFLQNQE